jgi:hypothetical protein
MSLFVPGINEFGWMLGSHETTRPAANMGITITPAQNAKSGAYAEYLDGALVLFDVYGIKINFNTNARSAAVGNTLVDIGVDITAGTSYTVLIPDLLACSSSPMTVGMSGTWYYFPVFIPAGTSIAARASVDNATVGTLRSMIWLYGKPRYPEQIRVGRRVEAIGEVTATSEGTVVVAGGAAEGTYTSMGTLTRDAWWYQIGVGSSDSSLSAGICDWDLAVGDATNKRLPSCQPCCRTMVTGTGEEMSQVNNMENFSIDGKAGQTVYIRGQHSGTPDTDVTCIAYAVGG